MRTATKAAIAFLGIFLVISFLAAAVWTFRAQILISGVRSAAGSEISFASWTGNPLRRSSMEKLVIWADKGKTGVSAENAVFDVNARDSLAQKAFVFQCRMTGVKIISGPDQGSRAGDLMSIPFSPGKSYDGVVFSCVASGNSIKITGFRASSPDVVVTGTLSYSTPSREIDIDVKVAFSPEFAGTIPEEIRQRVLSRDPDGWYSSQITYKGNLLLLKAIYSIAI